MKIQITSPKVHDPNNWHTWFAWHPIIVNDAGYVYLVWWENIERKRTEWDNREQTGYVYEYEFFKLP